MISLSENVEKKVDIKANNQFSKTLLNFFYRPEMTVPEPPEGWMDDTRKWLEEENIKREKEKEQEKEKEKEKKKEKKKKRKQKSKKKPKTEVVRFTDAKMMLQSRA